MSDLAAIIERLRRCTVLDLAGATEVVNDLYAHGIPVETLASAEPEDLLATWRWRAVLETVELSRDNGTVPKWAHIETWSHERLAMAEAVEAARKAFERDMHDVMHTLTKTTVLLPDSAERDRQAVADIVAGWDTRRRQ